jgi:hypothetical protein
VAGWGGLVTETLGGSLKDIVDGWVDWLLAE